MIEDLNGYTKTLPLVLNRNIDFMVIYPLF